MNATCPAGILQPQRVSDLGRLLNYEITAPLVFNTSMAPAHLQGALSNICKAPVHLQGAHTSPCARQFFIPTRGSVCPPTSKVAISSLSGVSKETWLSLISPLEMPDDACFASRSAQRRRSFPSTFNSKFSYLLFHPSITIHTAVVSAEVRLKFGRHDLAVLLRSVRRIFTSTAPSCSFIHSGRSAAACAFSRFFHDATPRMRGHKTPRGFRPTDMQIDARCASTSSARFYTTTSCTAAVPGASSTGLSAPRLNCNAMSTGARDSA